MEKVKVLICEDMYVGDTLFEVLFGPRGFQARGKADWRSDNGWPKPAYRVTFHDEALMRGFVMYVQACYPSVIILD